MFWAIRPRPTPNYRSRKWFRLYGELYICEYFDPNAVLFDFAYPLPLIHLFRWRRVFVGIFPPLWHAVWCFGRRRRISQLRVISLICDPKPISQPHSYNCVITEDKIYTFDLTPVTCQRPAWGIHAFVGDSLEDIYAYASNMGEDIYRVN